MPLVEVDYDPDFIAETALTTLSQRLPDIVAEHVPTHGAKLNRKEVEVRFRKRAPYDQNHPRLGIRIIANHTSDREARLDSIWTAVCRDVASKTGIDLPLEKGGRTRPLFAEGCYVWIMLMPAKFGWIGG